jgi:pimeloyl-ACP methyl ester carboxylesterase
MAIRGVGRFDLRPEQAPHDRLGNREFWQPMNPSVRKLFDLHRLNAYKRPAPLILVNGLAEQSESWFANRNVWSRHFDVKVPELLVYDGDSLHKRIDEGGEITVDYLTDRLADYLEEYVQRPPYNLVGSSLGGQIILTYAARYPKKVARLVLICPSGLHGDENLPMMEGVRRSQYDTLVKSVFHRSHFASEALIEAIERKFQDRKWKKGVLRTLRGTVGHSVAPLLSQVPHPTLLIWGANDHVISDVRGSIRAADQILKVRQVVIPKCGHAPQIEKSRLVNHLVQRFLRDGLKTIPPTLDPSRFLNTPDRKRRPRVKQVR